MFSSGRVGVGDRDESDQGWSRGTVTLTNRASSDRSDQGPSVVTTANAEVGNFSSSAASASGADPGPANSSARSGTPGEWPTTSNDVTWSGTTRIRSRISSGSAA